MGKNKVIFNMDKAEADTYFKELEQNMLKSMKEAMKIEIGATTREIESLQKTFGDFQKNEFAPFKKITLAHQEATKPFLTGVEGFKVIRWLIIWIAAPVAALTGAIIGVEKVFFK